MKVVVSRLEIRVADTNNYNTLEIAEGAPKGMLPAQILAIHSGSFGHFFAKWNYCKRPQIESTGNMGSFTGWWYVEKAHWIS